MNYLSTLNRAFARLTRHARSSLQFLACAAAIVSIRSLPVSNAADAPGEVVIYTSQDAVYAEGILRQFETDTGIRVRPVYDSEAVKTVGLANRLLAERAYPQCDVFWSNEELRTRQLAAKGVLSKEHPWRAMGFRTRRLGINTKYVPLTVAPHSLNELTNRAWKGKIALAYPLFGTTATHFLALRQVWGVKRWERWCRALAANQPFVVDGNSVAAKLVARGEAWICLTDSDDIAAENREGAHLAAVPIDEDTLLIPNTVAIVEGAPHLASALKLAEFLQQPAVLGNLIDRQALEGTSSKQVVIPTLRPNWDKLLSELEPATQFLKMVFLR